MKIILPFFILLLFSFSLVSAATIKGSIYNSQLDLEKDVLVEINTTPVQKFLAKEGSYEFNLPAGKYFLTASKGPLEIKEETNVVSEGVFIMDLFLLPDLAEEDELWQSTEEELVEDAGEEKIDWWRYVLIVIVLAVLFLRFAKMRKKYGPLREFRRKVKVEQAKTIEQHHEDLAREPGYLEEVLNIIQKNDGRATQKQIRKEMLHLSEAKISLIITELEHKGKVEKIKKGRGNVIVLKNI